MVAFALRYTRLGRQIFAFGGEPGAARLVGIPVSRVVLFVYGLSGLLRLTHRNLSRQPPGESAIRPAIPTFNLASITPVVLGGTPLTGGRGGVLGTLLGVFLVQTLNNVLNFLDISTFYQWMIQGLIVIAAVSIFVDKTQAGRMSSNVSARPKFISAQCGRGLFDRNGLLLFCLVLTTGGVSSRRASARPTICRTSLPTPRRSASWCSANALSFWCADSICR